MIQSLLKSRLSGFVLILVLLGFWQFSAVYLVKSPTWPPISDILEAWISNTLDGTIPTHLLATVARQMVGYGAATLLGIVVGLAMGYSKVLYNLFEPLVEILRPIPGPAYLPILVLFVGIGEEMKIVLILLASFFPVLLNTYSGVRSIDPVQLDTARTLGLSMFQTFREVIIPAASPMILTGMRISLAISLILAILGEMIVSNSGLGYYVLLAQRTFKIADMYAGIFTLALLGYVLNRLFLSIEKRAIRWHRESSGRPG